jgi:hypothetical protein
MAIELYDLTVAAYLQGLEGVAGVLAKGKAHAEATGVEPDSLVEARLVADMNPLRFQVQCAAHFSRGVIDGLKAGTFSPPSPWTADRYADLEALVAETRQHLTGLSREEVNDLGGRDLLFQAGEFKVPFVAEDFLTSFAIPNFYFHAATAYDILRARGVGLGKRDFMGPLKAKR